MRKFKKMEKFVRKYRADTSGQFSVITAMVGLPLLLIGAAVIDISQAYSKNESVRAAIDAAALGSVIPDNLSNDERYALAKTIFTENYLGHEEVSLQIGGDRERIDITAVSEVPTTISGILGVDYVKVSEQTAAVLTRADTVCLLTLDPTGDRVLEFSDQAVFNATACSVQVNSTSPFAMVSGVVTPPVASSFCVAGISQGEFIPFVKHACTPVADPYAGLTPPEDGACIDVKKLKGDNKTAQSFSDLVVGSETDESIGFIDYAGKTTIANEADVIGNGGVLVPGTYCNGLKIEGSNVQFLPGTYIIKKKGLEFKKYSAAVGVGVTLVLKGKKSRLSIKDDSQVYLKAQATGPYAGLVFYQNSEDGKPGKKPKKNPKMKNEKVLSSEIVSGGGLNIIGTAYFPTQELKITSLSPVITQSPATSFIAYRLKIGGRANLQVHVDYKAGGIPPILPRSDEGARLVK